MNNPNFKILFFTKETLFKKNVEEVRYVLNHTNFDVYNKIKKDKSLIKPFIVYNKNVFKKFLINELHKLFLQQREIILQNITFRQESFFREDFHYLISDITKKNLKLIFINDTLYVNNSLNIETVSEFLSELILKYHKSFFKCDFSFN